MPYIKQKEFSRLVNDQQRLEKITTILIQSLDNPPQDGICRVEDIAEDLVARSNLLFKVNEDNVVLQKQLDAAVDLLREVRVRADLEAEVNQDLNSKLSGFEDQTEQVQNLSEELHDLRANHRRLEEEAERNAVNVRRLKAALQSVLACV